jgi:hypothetical protein
MATIQCEIDDEVARQLAEVAAARGVDGTRLVAEVLTNFARREVQKREALTPEIIALAASFAEEDRQLAEADLDEYAARLAAEDRV